MNTFGNIFRITSAGESHGPALVGIVDGMPAGIRVDFGAVDAQMARRRPGGALASARREEDRVTFLSGLMDGVTTGTPIAFTIANRDQHSDDYENLRHTFRPSHADYTYHAKYGIRDHRGGGRASARETAIRVAAGALAMQALGRLGVKVTAYTSQIGRVTLTLPFEKIDPALIDSNDVRCPNPLIAEMMAAEIRDAAESGDTVGGVVSCAITGLAAGAGEPIYGKFQAMLASAMMSINAAHGFEYGMGFYGAGRRGSEMNDPFVIAPDGSVTTATNHSGGIQGGITNGAPVTFRVAFKPVATLMRDVDTVNDRGEAVTLRVNGRHDACVVPRAVPVVEAMAAIVALDALLMKNAGGAFS